MVLDRDRHTINHTSFEAIGAWLRRDDLLIANDSRGTDKVQDFR